MCAALYVGRDVPYPTSLHIHTTHSLSLSYIQGGMLALPAGLAAGAGTGYLPAYLLLGFSALSSAYTFVLVGRSVEATKARSFKEVRTSLMGG